MTTVHGDTEEEGDGFAYGQDERDSERRDAPGDPVDANDAKQLRDGVGDEVQVHAREYQCLGDVRVQREGDGRRSAQPGELCRDAVPGEIKEGKGEGVVVEHAFLPGRLCVGVGGACLGRLDVVGKDVVLGETEEAGEEEGEAEDGYTLGVEGHVGRVGI